jgi:probable HAF family extracellular repeat protein
MSQRLPLLLPLALVLLVSCGREEPASLSPLEPPLETQSTVVGKIVDLGTLGGVGSSALAVNDQEMVAGFSRVANGDVHAFLWTESTGMQDLGLGAALQINNHGVILIRRTGGYELWSAAQGSQPTGLDLSYTIADLNEDGVLVGQTPDGQAFRWSAGSGVEVLSGLGTGWSAAYSLNNHGAVVGYADTDVLRGGFLWEPGSGPRPLGSYPGATLTRPVALNESGQVAGVAFFSGTSYRAFRWSQAEGWTDVGAGLPAGIDRFGHVIGTADAKTHGWSYAFYWTPETGMTNLRWLPPRPLSSYANAMNNSGIVVGVTSRFDRRKAGVHGRATLWSVRS